MNPPQFSETTRQVVHMAMGVFALLLRFTPWTVAAVLAGAAIAFNIFGLPRMGGRRLYRPTEVLRGFPLGILLYPISVLLLILLFPSRLDIAASAWGILAFGDGAATMVGQRLGRRPIPWNRDKTVEGTLAFIVVGTAAGAFLSWWCNPIVVPPTFAWYPFAAPFAAAVVAALIESLPIGLDDNISVPFSAAAVLWALSLVSQDMLLALPRTAGMMAVWAVAANAVVAWIGHRARTVTVSGAISGGVIGAIIFTCAGWQAWTLLLATFALATICSRIGLTRKSVLGIAEERGGRRGAGNAIANTGIAAAAALMSAITYAYQPALLAFVAALTAGGSDTVASEIGKAWGRRTFLITELRRVPPGTSGAMSLEGTIAGLAGALLLAGTGAALRLIEPFAIWLVVAAATIGSLLESVMGATLEGPGILNNDVLNFLNTAAAAYAVLWLARVFG
jgi:uncharacterized protein (TIGR00297 family)